MRADLVEDVERSEELVGLLADDRFCAELWTAFANVTWRKAVPGRKDDEDLQWGASFRGMGGVIARLRNKFHGKNESYLDWYCSNYNPEEEENELPYGKITDRVREALSKIGWVPVVDEYYLEAN